MTEEVTYTLSNEYEKDVIKEEIRFNTITCLKLFELGNDALVLYMFYVKTAKIQGTLSVYALNSFCKKGLGWGDYKFNKAKKLLVDNKLIETVVKRDENNVITGHYIRIHYLKKKEVGAKKPNKITSDAAAHKMDRSSLWVEPPCGSGETNTINKKGNTNNKEKGNTNNKKSTIAAEVPNELKEEIFNFWMSKRLMKHKKFTTEMKKAITRAINDGFTEHQLKDAINNYDLILNDQSYLFSYKWNLADFLVRGLTDHGVENIKGFRIFLSENEPFKNLTRNRILSEVDLLKEKFKPITSEYSIQNLLDTENETYYGFPLERIKNNKLMKEYIADIKDYYNNDRMEYGHFIWLETAIASMFFHRKSGCDTELLKALMSVWEDLKSVFKRTAIKLMEER